MEWKQLSKAKFSSVAQCSTLRPHDCSMPGLPVHKQLPGFTQTHVHWVSDAIQPSHPSLPHSPLAILLFPACLQSFTASGNFLMSQFLTSGGQSIGVSASTSVLPMNTQDWPPLGWTDLLAVQGTLESSPTPQFKSINSSALSFLYSPTLTSIHDHWKNHSFD